jgi:hypothetical protein
MTAVTSGAKELGAGLCRLCTNGRSRTRTPTKFCQFRLAQDLSMVDESISSNCCAA